MPIKIIAIGKKHDSWVAEGIDRYQKRLKRPFTIEWVILPHSSQSELVARQKESSAILSHVNPDEYVILLDEIGDNISSVRLANVIGAQMQRSKQIVFVIGGAYGVDETVRKRADFVWSLSKLVFPHQLVRLILTEQIYRSQEIADGKPYHHE